MSIKLFKMCSVFYHNIHIQMLFAEIKYTINMNPLKTALNESSNMCDKIQIKTFN